MFTLASVVTAAATTAVADAVVFGAGVLMFCLYHSCVTVF